MRTKRAVCLSLEVDFEGERVTGWLADDQGNDWAFSCWLDLLSAIERALDGAGAGGWSGQLKRKEQDR
jgi:hypothetical protein